VALEVLAGPFAIVDGEANVLVPSIGQLAFYADGLGLCTYDASLGGYCIIQLDGTTYLRSDTLRPNQYTIDLQRPGEYLAHDSLFEAALYLFDKRAGVFGELVLSGATNFVVDIQVRASDRYLSVAGSAVRFKPLDNSGSWTSEATLVNAGSGAPTISRTRIDGVLCLAYANGAIVYYDAIAKEQKAGAAAIGANNGAWFSPKHNIIVALVDYEVKVFATVPRPAALSNPVVETALTRGKVSRVKVQLTGADGEVCANEIIAWSMTGDGELAYSQSTTDSNGWAYNDFRAPVTGAGSATINAEARF
jgi:hypothetical protein